MATDGISWQELRAELETLRYELKADIAQIASSNGWSHRRSSNRMVSLMGHTAGRSF